MSIELMALTTLVASIAIIGIVRPAMLFEYPIAAAMLMWFFIVPQAWKIEASGEMNDYEPTTTWVYVILCTVMLIAGFHISASRTKNIAVEKIGEFGERYDINKLFHGAMVLGIVGALALILMIREAATMEASDQWSGPIAFYVMMASLLVYGSALAWILFLYSGSKKALLLAVSGFAANLPAILFGARRELTFTVACAILLGLFFVKKKSINRLVLVPLILIGSVLVNQAGAIRGQIAAHDSSLLEAMTSQDVRERDADKNYAETASAVSDIALTSWSGEYKFLSPYYNTLVQLYVPAFIVGHNVKDSLKADANAESDNNTLGSRYFANGATRTGYSDSFLAFHYFGCAIFFFIAYFMGVLWAKSKAGDVMAQFYYIILLPAGLKSITESTSIFLGAMPLIFCSTWLVFRYARRVVTPTIKSSQNELVSSWASDRS